MDSVDFIKNKTDMRGFNSFIIKSLLLFVFWGAAQNSYGQVFKGEVILGGNLTQVEGDRVNGYKQPGFRGGLGVMLPFRFKQTAETKQFAVSMEILFCQRGARQKNPNHSPKDTIYPELTNHKFDYRLRLNYVSLPFQFHFTDRDLYTFGVGFAYNHLVTSKEIEKDILQTYDSVPHFKPSDFTVVGDFRFRIWQQLKAGIRFEYSMFSIRTRHFPATIYKLAETKNQYNNSLSLYFIYMFNEKRTDIDKEKRKIKQTYYY